MVNIRKRGKVYQYQFEILLKKKYGRKYKKYELEPIKNEYGKINEYKVIESKHKNLNSVEMVFTKNNGSYVGTDIIMKL